MMNCDFHVSYPGGIPLRVIVVSGGRSHADRACLALPTCEHGTPDR